MAMISAARKSAVVRFTSWSPSRLDDYDRCPYFARLKHLDKLCTICYAGKLLTPRGMPFGTPQVCTSCGGTPKKGDALERGGAIGDRLDKYLCGEAATPGETIVHPKVMTVVNKARADVRSGKGQVQLSVRLTAKWEPIPGDDFDPRSWLYVKLDFRRVVAGKAHVTDWKTGGVEKKGRDLGKVKVVDKYDDQLLTYQAVTLATCPKVKEATSDLVFLDCLAPHDPVLKRPTLKREALTAAQKKLEKKVAPMFNDTVFAPRSSYACNWCDYSKGKGGPCKF